MARKVDRERLSFQVMAFAAMLVAFAANHAEAQPVANPLYLAPIYSLPLPSGAGNGIEHYGGELLVDSGGLIRFLDPVSGTESRTIPSTADLGGMVTASTSNLVMTAVVAPGGTCGEGACWKETSVGFIYNGPNERADGINGIRLKSGVEGKASIIVRGAGPNIPMPTPVTETRFLHEDADVVVQLVRDDSGICWEARYPAPARKNTGTAFKDGSP